MGSKKFVYRFLLTTAIFFVLIFLMQIVELLFVGNIPVLNPKGIIALRERNLLFIVQGLMLLVVLPVFFLSFYFAWKYRASNQKAKYDPEWDDHPVAEMIWWGFPFLIVLVISILTWVRTVELDPYKPLVSDKKPVTVQVVALQWKWLFIYPEEGVASVNFFQIPENTPIHFEITADAPMNSFWIPQLGGQIFAMPKMRTQLNLIADKAGEYYGSSANISGRGFAGMHFIAKATSQEEFDAWVKEGQTSTSLMAWEQYVELAKPSENVPTAVYHLEEKGLFEKVIMQYLLPEGHGGH